MAVSLVHGASRLCPQSRPIAPTPAIRLWQTCRHSHYTIRSPWTQFHGFNLLSKAPRVAESDMALQAAGEAWMEATAETEELTEEQRVLNDFLVWLTVNNVQGIGLDDSPAALYQGVDGERGLVALKDIAKGEVLLRVPLRLALTDHAADAESNKLVYSEAPWSVRLATKLLREQAKGPHSSWYPYLKVLPNKVPAPLEVFSWEDMQQVEWPPAQAAIYEYNWMVTGAYNRAAGAGPDTEQLEAIKSRLTSDDEGHGDGSSWVVDEGRGMGSPAPSEMQIQQVLGGADADQFQWAMSVVHSRTFANAAPGGGVGVRMLVPLVDMLNHAGDESASGLMDDEQIKAQDNVRWDLLSPASSPLGCWEMAVSATQAIHAGDQLLLSYGERSSDDFFLHYGFVPPLCNPHEDAVIFEDAEEALEWHHAQYAAEMPQDAAEELYTRAYMATVEEQKNAVATAADRRLQELNQQGARDPASGGEEDQQHKQNKPPKGWQKLKVYSRGRVDPALMTAFTLASGGDVRAADMAVCRRAREVLASMKTPLLMDLLALYHDAKGREDPREGDVIGRLLLQQAKQQRRVEAVEAAQADGGAVEGTGLMKGKVEKERCPEARDLEGLVAALTEQQTRLAAAAGVPVLLQAPLTSSQLLLVRFRAAKKIVLWGVVHGAMCPRGDMPQADQIVQVEGSPEGEDLLASLPQRKGLQGAMVPRL